MNWFILGLTKYAQFTGRSPRQEYWMYVLFYVLIAIGLSIVDRVLGLRLLGPVFALAMLVPNLAAGARRLHDTGRSGWWQLIGIIPLVGWIVLIIFLAQDSSPDNEHGPNPKGGLAAAGV